MAAKKRFQAVMGGGDGGDLPLVELPFDVRAAFGSARPKVKVTVNGVELRTTVSVYGGRSYIGFRKEIREAARIGVGDRIRVEMELDTAVREVDVPDELARALAKNKAAKKFFDGLAFTQRKEYARWISEAKKPETRERRIARAMEMLKNGQKFS